MTLYYLKMSVVIFLYQFRVQKLMDLKSTKNACTLDLKKNKYALKI